MPGQRKPGKKSIGGYVPKEIKAAIKLSGLDESGFVELASVRYLYAEGSLTADELQALADEGRLRPTTVMQLRQDQILKTTKEKNDAKDAKK